MATLDTLISGAKGVGSSLLDTLNQPHVRNAVGIMALAVPAALTAKSLSKKRDRPGAVGNVAKIFGNLALKELYRPREEKKQLIDFLGQQKLLTPEAPTPGATPRLTLAGQPLYDVGTLAQRHPDVFTPPPEPLPPGMAGPPEPVALPPSLQILGGSPATRESTATLADIIHTQELAQQEAERRADTLQTLLGYQGGAGGEGSRLRLGMDSKGNLVPTVMPPRALSPRDQAFLKLSPEEQRDVQLGKYRGRPPAVDKIITLRNQARKEAGQAPMTAAEEAQERESLMRMGPEAFMERMQKTMNLELLRKEITKTQDDLRPFQAILEQYGGNPDAIDPDSQAWRRLMNEHGRGVGITTPQALKGALQRLGRLREEVTSSGTGQSPSAPPVTEADTETRAADWLRKGGYLR